MLGLGDSSAASNVCFFLRAGLGLNPGCAFFLTVFFLRMTAFSMLMVLGSSPQ
jgi:hypothetical protein